jgi:hypothetical protein
VRASAAGGLALTGGVFTHGDQSAQAFRENYFVATSVHSKILNYCKECVLSTSRQREFSVKK